MLVAINISCRNIKLQAGPSLDTGSKSQDDFSLFRLETHTYLPQMFYSIILFLKNGESPSFYAEQVRSILFKMSNVKRHKSLDSVC